MTSANGNDTSSAVQAAALFDASAHDTTFSRWLAIAAALYLLASCKANWRHINIGMMPLVLLLVLNLPSILFNIIWEDFGKWIIFLFVTLHLFFRQYILDFCGFPVALVLLTVTVPQMLARYLRNNIIGATISVAMGSFLLDGHIRSRRPSPTFSKVGYCVNSLAVIALLICPLLEVYQFTNDVWQQSSDG